MIDFTALPDQDAASYISAFVKEWDTLERQRPIRYSQIGLMCLAVEKRELFRFVDDPNTGEPCHSLGNWLHGQLPAPFARSTASSGNEGLRGARGCPVPGLGRDTPTAIC